MPLTETERDAEAAPIAVFAVAPETGIEKATATAPVETVAADPRALTLPPELRPTLPAVVVAAEPVAGILRDAPTVPVDAVA
jgi:hypothetical protein